jgi:hypothetical protein
MQPGPRIKRQSRNVSGLPTSRKQSAGNSTTGTADLAKVPSYPREQRDPDKDVQTNLAAYAVMAALKLVPTSLI